MKIDVFQTQDKGTPADNIENARQAICRSQADFFILPEFFSIPTGDFRKDYSLEECYLQTSVPAQAMLRQASRVFGGYLIGGSVLEKADNVYYNTCYVYQNGQTVASYRKINITQEEIDLGITPGTETVIFETPFGRAGLIICADVINRETVTKVASKCDIIFLPVSGTNPDHPPVKGHPLSVKIADLFKITIVKVARINVFGGKPLFSSSAVVMPGRVVWEAGEKEELATVII